MLSVDQRAFFVERDERVDDSIVALDCVERAFRDVDGAYAAGQGVARLFEGKELVDHHPAISKRPWPIAGRQARGRSTLSFRLLDQAARAGQQLLPSEEQIGGEAQLDIQFAEAEVVDAE